MLTPKTAAAGGKGRIVAFGPSASSTGGGSAERGMEAEIVVATRRASSRQAAIATPLAQWASASRKRAGSRGMPRRVRPKRMRAQVAGHPGLVRYVVEGGHTGRGNRRNGEEAGDDSGGCG